MTTKLENEYKQRIRAVSDDYNIPGRDHLSVLLYLQTVFISFAGVIKADHHGDRMRWQLRSGWKPEYGTRYWDGTTKPDHDDFDCMYDLEELDLISTSGTGMNPVVTMKSRGNDCCLRLTQIRQWYDNSRPRPERQGPTPEQIEAARAEVERELEAQRMVKHRRSQRAYKAAATRRRKAQEAKERAERLHFKGSIDVPQEDMHPSTVGK